MATALRRFKKTERIRKKVDRWTEQHKLHPTFYWYAYKVMRAYADAMITVERLGWKRHLPGHGLVNDIAKRFFDRTKPAYYVSEKASGEFVGVITFTPQTLKLLVNLVDRQPAASDFSKAQDEQPPVKLVDKDSQRPTSPLP